MGSPCDVMSGAHPLCSLQDTWLDRSCVLLCCSTGSGSENQTASAPSGIGMSLPRYSFLDSLNCTARSEILDRAGGQTKHNNLRIKLLCIWTKKGYPTFFAGAVAGAAAVEAGIVMPLAAKRTAIIF